MSTRAFLALLPLAGCCSQPASLPDAAAIASTTWELVRVVPLKHAAAADLASTLNDLLDSSRRAAEARGARICFLPGPDYVPPRKRVETSIVPDERTNSLVVRVDHENRDQLMRIVELVARLDIDCSAD